MRKHKHFQIMERYVEGNRLYQIMERYVEGNRLYQVFQFEPNDYAVEEILTYIHQAW